MTSRYVDPSFSDAFALECRAMRKVRDTIGLTNAWVMIPFVRTLDAGRKVVEVLKKNGLVQGENGLKIITMCEVPSNARRSTAASAASDTERGQDGTGPGTLFRTLARQPPERIARMLEFVDLRIEGPQAALGQLARAGAILAGIQTQEFPDFTECETRCLRLPDEAQTPHVFAVVAADTGFARGPGEQAPALIEADGLHTDATRGGQLSDRQRHPLTLYHGTDPIVGPTILQEWETDMSTRANRRSPGGKAVIHRMVMPHHTCPYGLKAMDLLKRAGYEVEDHPLSTREETEAFKAQHGVATTPQVFIAGERIGGYEDVRRFLGKRVEDPKATSYRPVLALFAMSALTALAASYAATGDLFGMRSAQWFVSFSMVMLAWLKLQNIETFSTMFLNYDLLAGRWVPYGYLYPFAEGLAGVLMTAGVLAWLSVPLAFFIGSIGAASVFKAVYIDRRELKCACVGGSSNVPLGFVSLTENLMMIAMAIWMGLAAT